VTNEAEHHAQYHFEGFTLDPKQRILRGPDGVPVPLNSRAFDTLLVLVENPGGGLIDKDRLMKAVWPNTVVEENSLNKAISQIRRALQEKPGEHRFIVTVPGRGFGFVPEVRRSTERAPTNDPAAPTRDPAASAPGRPVHDRHSSPRRGGLTVGLTIVGIAVLCTGAYVLSQRSSEHRGISSPASAPASTGPSIVVLPLVNLSTDADQQYFADGLSEELMNQLGELRGLRVIGRSSAFALAGRHEDLRTIGRTLGVSHVLEGSVRRSGDDLRITVRLNDAATGAQLWSSTYDRKRGDIFEVQKDIAESVAGKLRLALGPDETHRRGATPDVEAYEAYLVSSAQLTRVSTQGDIHRTIAELERAVARDPDFALGWEALAHMYAALADLGYEPDEESRRKSMLAITRALELAPESPRILSTAAMMSMQLRDWAGAERRLLKALATSGGENFDANLTYGWFLDNVGRGSEALAAFKRAQVTDPLSPRVAMQIETNYLIRGDVSGADIAHKKARELATHYPWGNGYEYLRSMALGDRARIQQILDGAHTPLEAQLRAMLRESRNTRSQLQQLIDDPRNERSSLQLDILAHWAVFFGENDLAMRALRKAFGPGTNTFYLWRVDLKPLRGMPEFKALVRDLGLYDYWRASGNWGSVCKPRGDDDFVCE
jgi:TolB-like protein/DNA-binding winged helix-turn-helix (wHTH) protein/Flp pilus assembly protein TadD